MGRRAFIFTGQGEGLDVENPQLVTFWMSVALAKALIMNGEKPDALAGLSLGEFACYAIAGCLSVEELEQILTFRQITTDEIFAKCDTGMIACIGMKAENVRRIALKCQLEITNYNAPMQVVVGGEKKNLKRFENDVLNSGCGRLVNLAVKGAFHSSYLDGASKKMREYLEKYEIKKPAVPIYYDVTGDCECENMSENIVEHLIRPVRFQEIIENMIKDGIEEFVSIGIGTTPVGLIWQIGKGMGVKIKVKKVESIDDVERVLK